MNLPPSGLLSLATLFAGIAVLGCSDSANPVLPPSGKQPPGGLQGGRGLDGAVPLDARPAVADAGPDLPNQDLAGACTAGCNLLQQDCQCTGFACYPSLGVGRCQTAGSTGALGTCMVPNDCAPNYTCIVDPQFGVTGTCQRLCDPSYVPPACGVCNKLSGSTTVGACNLPN